jgi:MurNAc alpha-1-phosphate uridylyltransferase
MMPPLALLAGGLATRMRPHTETVPKALLEVAGEPFIAHQLRLLHREGIREVVLCVGYLREQIEAFVGNGAAWRLSVRYSPDGETLLGTGGALRKALPLLGPFFFVMYGDSYLDTAFGPIAETFFRTGRDGLMAVYRNEGRFDISNVEFAGGLVVRYNKNERTPAMHWTDYGLGMLKSTPLEWRAPNIAFDLATVYTELADTGRLSGFEVMQRFYEIGSPSGLRETDQYLRRMST